MNEDGKEGGKEKRAIINQTEKGRKSGKQN
jgi:hypothetical protein